MGLFVFISLFLKQRDKKMEFDLQRFKRQNFLAGCDEVGRGPLAGPVVGACAYFTGTKSELKKTLDYLDSLGLTDSKKLTDKKRERIFSTLGIIHTKKKQHLKSLGITLCINEMSHEIIDEINILQASLLSMKNSFLAVWDQDKDGELLIDGNKDIELPVRTSPIVKGDFKSLLIGLASVAAKVYRDKLMSDFATKYPHYDFEKNAGYPTKSHRQGIEKFGITPIHRRTFKGVKEYVQEPKL